MEPRSDDVTIGLARPDDIAALPSIEREAAKLFAALDLPASVLESTTELEDFEQAQRAELLWVARCRGSEPVGFALVDLVGGAPHLEEMDVRPAFGRRGIGARLLRAVLAWARDAGHEAVTLTTFRDVPWNAPFYARHGFRPLAEGELSRGLRELVAEESARGLDPAKRVVMACRVGVSSRSGARPSDRHG
jgi:GNAT superfamily N-acetyltransferase